MTKALEASCTGSVVQYQGFPVPGTTILSEGVGASQGVLLVDEDKTVYVANTSPDLKETIDKLVTSLNTIGESLDLAVTIFGKHFGVFGPKAPATPVDPALADITALTNKVLLITGPNGLVQQLNLLKGSLK